MLFLYRQVICYVPPITADSFSEFFGMDFNSFLELSDPESEDQFIFPLLDHPDKYSHKDVKNSLFPLLKRMPPTWERWHEVLRHTGGDKWFAIADEIYNYESALKIEGYRNARKKVLRSNKKSIIDNDIRQQIRNNFTNLCLIGNTKYACEIAELSNTSPTVALNELLLSSEYFAYPKVMGGGKPNIHLGDFKHRPIIMDPKITPKRSLLKHYDYRILKVLIKGLKFDKIPAVYRVDFLKKWHKSNNAAKAREAYGALVYNAMKVKGSSDEDIHEVVQKILEELELFCEESMPNEASIKIHIEEKNKRVTKFANISNLFAGALGLLNIYPFMNWVASNSASLYGQKKQGSKENFIKKLLEKHATNVDPKLFFLMQDLKNTSITVDDMFKNNGSDQTRLPEDPLPVFWNDG